MSDRPKITFVISPKLLPNPRKLGRTVLLDLAFAYGDLYQRVTRPFLQKLGDRLVTWIDHHPHPGWSEVEGDPRFVLVDRHTAPACPELVTPERVLAAGVVDDVLAHGDFDGCISAAKFVRGGESPYELADADARAIDAPGRGFICSARGQRLALALDFARDRIGSNAYLRFVGQVADALIIGAESPLLATELDERADAQRSHLLELDKLLVHVTQPHPEVAMLHATGLSNTDRKSLLRRLEERARVGLLDSGDGVTVGTFDTTTLDLSSIPGLEGTRGIAWSRRVDGATALAAVIALLAD